MVWHPAAGTSISDRLLQVNNPCPIDALPTFTAGVHTCVRPLPVCCRLGGPLMTDELSQRKPAHQAALMTNGSCVSHLMCLSVSLTLLPLAV